MANRITQDEAIQRMDDETIPVLLTEHISRVARVDEDAQYGRATHPGGAEDEHDSLQH